MIDDEADDDDDDDISFTEEAESPEGIFDFVSSTLYRSRLPKVTTS